VAKLRKRQTEYKDMVKVKLKVNLTQEQAMKTQRGSRGIALLFLSRWGGWSTPRPSRFIPRTAIQFPLYKRE